MCTEDDAAIIASYAEEVLPLAAASLGEEYFYQSLPLCVIDAVFSIGIRYSGVKRVVGRYCEYTNQHRIREGGQAPPIEDQEAMKIFCDRCDRFSPEQMADQIYQSRQRTSTCNGILKADAVAMFARCLRSYDVAYFQDLERISDNPAFEADIKAIPGQGAGFHFSISGCWLDLTT
ncbi:MAG: hypothetical protein WAL90_02280 [Desulfobacterales bacterium]